MNEATILAVRMVIELFTILVIVGLIIANRDLKRENRRLVEEGASLSSDATQWRLHVAMGGIGFGTKIDDFVKRRGGGR